jgi:hypothetical protein
VKGKEEPDLLWLFGLEGRGTWQEGAWDWYKKQQQRKSQRWLLDSNLERNWAGVEWEVAAASDSELGLLFQPAKAINWKPYAGIGVEENGMRRICCSWLESEPPLLALARIAGAKGGLQLTEDCCWLWIGHNQEACCFDLLWLEGERWLLAILHLAWERKELTQRLASSRRKKYQREGSKRREAACCFDEQRTG